MYAVLTPQQVRDGEQYYKQEPFGDREIHALLSILITVVINALSKSKVKPQDFMPGRPKHIKMTNRQKVDSVRNWVNMVGKVAH